MGCARAAWLGLLMTGLSANAVSTPVSNALGAEDGTGARAIIEKGAEAPRDLPDVRLAADPKVSEQSESVAHNPKDARNLLVAISRAAPNEDCVVRSSADGGRTWQRAVKLPAPVGRCSDAVVAYAPDGKRAYAALVSKKPGCNGDVYCMRNDILVSVSEDEGATWSAPVTAMTIAPDAIEGIWYAKPKLATPLRDRDSKHVYIVARRSDTPHYSHVMFAQSSDRGRTWSAPQRIASSDYMEGGAGEYGVAGGLGGEVLLVWDTNYYFNGLSEVRAARSRDFGRAFAASVVALQAYDMALYDPDVTVDGRGMAHIAYRTRDADDLQSVQYISSRGAPYATWSAPVTLNDGGPGHTIRAPAVDVENCGRGSLLHVSWLESRRDPGVWDVLYTRKVVGPEYEWSKNIRVSDRSSLADPTWSSGGNGLSAGGGGAFAVWTHRRHGADPGTYTFDVYGSRIASGLSCAPRDRDH